MLGKSVIQQWQIETNDGLNLSHKVSLEHQVYKSQVYM